MKKRVKTKRRNNEGKRIKAERQRENWRIEAAIEGDAALVL